VYLLRASDGLSAAVAQYAIPVLAYQLTGSAAWAGAAFAAEWAPRLLGLAAGGRLVDRFAPRAVLLAAALIRVLAMAGGVIAVASGAGAAVVVAVGACCGLVAQVAYLAAESLGAAVGRGTNATRVQAAQTAIDQGVLLVGPLAGGVLLLTGPAVALGLIAALAALTAVIAFTGLTATTVGRRSQKREHRAGLKAGFAALRATPALCWMTAGLAGVNLLAGIMTAAAPVLVASFGHSSAATGATWSATAAAALLAALVCARLLDRVGPLAVIVTASLTGALAAAAAGWSSSYPQFLIAMAVLGLAEGGALVAMRTVRARLLPLPVFGSAIAVMILFLLAPMPLGGLLLAVFGEQRLPLLLAGAALFHTLLTWATARGLRRYRNTLNLSIGSCS
jgi:MFS family permease